MLDIPPSVEAELRLFIDNTAKELVNKFGYDRVKPLGFWVDQAELVAKWSSWAISTQKKQFAFRILSPKIGKYPYSDQQLIDWLASDIGQKAYNNANIEIEYYLLRWVQNGNMVTFSDVNPLDENFDGTYPKFDSPEIAYLAVNRMKEWYQGVGITMPDVELLAYDKNRNLIKI